MHKYLSTTLRHYCLNSLAAQNKMKQKEMQIYWKETKLSHTAVQMIDYIYKNIVAY